VPSYNNVKNDRHRKNLQSILQQEYQNYHLVFIDDASTDGTGAQVEAMLANQTQLPPERYVVIRNKEQKRAMPNLRRAADEFCKGEEVFLIVDGDDELLGRQVLHLFNAVMQ
jgi:glycosyltransferase involved in cell wall biosynthesis